MFTTRREGNEGYAREATAGGGVGLLERAPVAENTAAYGEAHTESVDEAKLRMQRNLDKLLHYDEADYSAAEVSVPETEKAEQVTELPETKEHQNRNISTQFFSCFDEIMIKKMEAVLEKNRYIPQEILNIADF